MCRSRMSSYKSASRTLLTSVVLAYTMLFLAGCGFEDIFDFELNFAGPGCCSGMGHLDFGPGFLYADSTSFATEDSLTLHAHFQPNTTEKLHVIEYGFQIIENDSESTFLSVTENKVWEFQDLDTVVYAAATIERITRNVNAFFIFYVNVRKGEGVSVYQSGTFPIRSFEPDAFAVNDSVTFIAGNKAVLWAHIETKRRCEIIDASFLWGQYYNFDKKHTVSTASVLKANEFLALRDTISIAAYGYYQWLVLATVKFDNDSVAVTNGPAHEFYK